MDRNIGMDMEEDKIRRSLSARRAWIEMESLTYGRCVLRVALRKESVDRNEGRTDPTRHRTRVALRKESVDRNFSVAMAARTSSSSLSARRAWIEMSHNQREASIEQRRSPQGEHGMFLFLTVQGGFVHADIRFNFKNCYSKKIRIK